MAAMISGKVSYYSCLNCVTRIICISNLPTVLFGKRTIFARRCARSIRTGGTGRRGDRETLGVGERESGRVEDSRTGGRGDGERWHWRRIAPTPGRIAAVKGRGEVGGIAVHGASPIAEPAFQPRPITINSTIEDILLITEEEFRIAFKGSAVK
jgi:hypothetical protein